MGISNRQKFIEALDSRHSIMFAHIYDMALKAEKQGRCVYGDFLSENSISTLLSRKSLLPLEPVLFGGVEDAERCMVGFIPDCENALFPISAVKITSPHLKSLTHRDVLGSMLSKGIKREKCGDIIMNDDEFYLLVHSDIASFLSDSLEKIGRVGVKSRLVELCDVKTVPKKLSPVTGTVSSLRLDAVISLFTGKGRSAAAELIGAGYVFVNGICAEKNDMHLHGDETISVRGFGKGILSVGGKSKKDRIFITVNKFV